MFKLRSRTAVRPAVGLAGLVTVLVLVFGVFAGSAPARGVEYPTNRSAPSVSGVPQEGQTLHGSNGQWLYSNGLGCGSECVFTYQWQRCNAGAGACADIPGATTTSYTLAAADVGNRVRMNNTMTKHDCNATNTECRDVATTYPSAPTSVVSAKPVAAPQKTTAPSITGVPKEGSTLTIQNASFNGGQPMTNSYQWSRCDAAGNNCAAIAGATAQTYTAAKADVGSTLRATHTATNSGGSDSSISAPTAVVTPLRPAAGPHAVWVDEVLLPNRLRIDRFTYSPKPVTARTTLTVTFRVTATSRFQVRDAVVSVLTIPFGQFVPVASAKTGSDGTVTFVLQPTVKVPQDRIYLYVSARKPGDVPDAGISANRLFTVRVAKPLK